MAPVLFSCWLNKIYRKRKRASSETGKEGRRYEFQRRRSPARMFALFLLLLYSPVLGSVVKPCVERDKSLPPFFRGHGREKLTKLQSTWTEHGVVGCDWSTPRRDWLARARGGASDAVLLHGEGAVRQSGARSLDKWSESRVHIGSPSPRGLLKLSY